MSILIVIGIISSLFMASAAYGAYLVGDINGYREAANLFIPGVIPPVTRRDTVIRFAGAVATPMLASIAFMAIALASAGVIK